MDFRFCDKESSVFENVVSFRVYFRSILNPFSVICFKELLDLAIGDILIDISRSQFVNQILSTTDR